MLKEMHCRNVDEVGRRDGAVTRKLASDQCGLGSMQALRHMLVEYVAGSRLAPTVSVRFLRFSILRKNQHSKFKFDLESGTP